MTHHRLPHVCARCAKGEPVATWPVYGPTRCVDGPSATVSTTPFIDVPVCSACWWSMTGIKLLAWLIGLCVGGFVFLYFNDFDVLRATRAMLLGGGLIGLIIVPFVTWGLLTLMSSEITVGKIVPELGAVVFHNEAYQAMFERAN